MQSQVFAGFDGVMKNIIRVTALIWIVGFTNTTVAGETEGEIFGGKASGWMSLGTDRVLVSEPILLLYDLLQSSSIFFRV